MFQYPNLYNDIAVLELGRRIAYDYDTFGDTPSCLNVGKFDTIGKIATIQVISTSINDNLMKYTFTGIWTDRRQY